MAAFVVVFPYFPALNSPNENVRVWAARAIAAHGTLAIDAVEREWGEVGDRAAHGGRRYSGKAPGTSLLGVPVLVAQAAAWRALGLGAPTPRATTRALRLFAVALPLALFFLWFGRAAARATGSPAARDLLTLGLGLGTLMYPMGVLFVGHALAAAAGFGAFLLVRGARDADSPARSLALAGGLAGLAVLLEYQALLVAIAVAGYALFAHGRRSLAFFLGALPAAGALLAYHAAAFGSPFAFPYAFVDDPAYRLAGHGAGFFGLGAPRAAVAAKLLGATDVGLFAWSPFLLLGAAGAALALLRGPRAEAAVVLGVVAALVALVSGMANWRAGWCAGGPRYLTAATPFLAWGVVLGWKTLHDRIAARAALVAGLAAAIVLCGIAGAHFPHYPPQFASPVFDVSLRLLGEGLAADGLGRALGLPGAAAMAPAGAALAGALALAFAALRGRRAALAAAIFGAAALLWLSARAGGATAAGDDALAFLRLVWFSPR